MLKILYIYLQENFVLVKRDETFYFMDGRQFHGKHSRYLMQHAGCAGKISAEQMWAFIHKIEDSDLGMIHRYSAKAGPSRRLKTLCRKVSRKWSYILHDLPGVFFLHDRLIMRYVLFVIKHHVHISVKQRSSIPKVAAFLKSLSVLKQLDTAAYMDKINKKRIRQPKPKPKAESQPLSRRAKKRIHKLEKQNNRLRSDNKRLRADNRNLRVAVLMLSVCLRALRGCVHCVCVRVLCVYV